MTHGSKTPQERHKRGHKLLQINTTYTELDKKHNSRHVYMCTFDMPRLTGVHAPQPMAGVKAHLHSRAQQGYTRAHSSAGRHVGCAHSKSRQLLHALTVYDPAHAVELMQGVQQLNPCICHMKPPQDTPERR